MSFPKRHHYLPAFYLERFTKDGYLWVYDRTQRAFRREQPKNTAVRTHYYSFRDEQGKTDPRVEEGLAALEGLAKPVLEKLERSEQISPHDRYYLSLFLGVLYCRVPRFEREVDEILTGTLRMILLRNLRDPVASKRFTAPERGLEYVSSDRFKVKAARNFTISNMVRQGWEIGKAFFKSDWVVARAAQGTTFVTCDVPIGILGGPESSHLVGVASPEVIKAVPISPRVCLLMTGNQAKLAEMTLGPDAVRDANLAVLRETETYAIARDKTQFRKLVLAAGLEDPNRRSSMVVKEFSDPSGDPMKSIVISYRSNP